MKKIRWKAKKKITIWRGRRFIFWLFINEKTLAYLKLSDTVTTMLMIWPRFQPFMALIIGYS